MAEHIGGDLMALVEKKVQVCLMINPSLYKKLGDHAKATGRSRSQLSGWLLEKALRELIKKESEES